MRSASWAMLLIVPCSLTACAAQNAEHERHVKELEARVRQLTTRCERLEERLLAVETFEREGPRSSAVANATSSGNAMVGIGSRPDLPTVKASPHGSQGEGPNEPDVSTDANAGDSNRLVIVGEGTRVETRVAGDTSVPPTMTTPGKANSRAAKRAPNTATGTSPVGATP